jgi:cyclopropane fatty-acyl-phospholipid synthase-like methyltransferase
LRELGAVDLDTAFPGEGFDVVVSILVFSELSDDEIEYVLAQCRRLLRPDGRLIIADEVLPDSTLGRIGTFLLRLPFVIAAYLLTQNTTRRVADLEARIARSGFRVTGVNEYLLGTMRLVFAGKVV